MTEGDLWGAAKNIGSSIWDFASSPGGGAVIGGLGGAALANQTDGGGYTVVPTGESSSWGSNSSGTESSSKGSSWSGTADYMDPYTKGAGGIYPEAKGLYEGNREQGYFGQTPEQGGINADIASTLQQYLTNPGAVQGQMNQAGSFGDRYNSQLSGVNPNVQAPMNQFLGGNVDTNTLDGLQQAATNRAMVGYGDAVQDAGNMFTQQIAPSIRSGAMLSGQYGGSRQGIAEGVSTGMIGQQLGRNARDLGIASTDMGGQLYSDAYQQARDNQYGMSQFGAGFGLEQNEQGMRNLAQNAGMEQQGLGMGDDAISRYMAGQQGSFDAFGRNVADQQAGQNFGWEQLANYMAAVQGQGQESTSKNQSSSISNSAGSSGGSSTSSSTVPGTGYNMLEGAGYGATIGSGLGQLAGGVAGGVVMTPIPGVEQPAFLNKVAAQRPNSNNYTY